jgi:hypothetical protein
LDILAGPFFAAFIHVTGEIELGGCAAGEQIIPATMWESAIIFLKLRRKEREMKQPYSVL